MSSLSSYRGSDSDVEEIKNDKQSTFNFFPSGNEDVENKIESPDTVIEINAATSIDTSEQDKRSDAQPNIHEIAYRLHTGSDIGV